MGGAVLESDRGQHPNDEGVGNGRAESEQGGLENSATDGDDEGGHHRFGVTWFEAMEGPENNCDGNVEPDMCRALLEEVQ